MNNVERELKMLLTKEEYEALLKVGNPLSQLQVNYYFRYDNMPVFTMLRIRQKNGRYLFCCKRLLSAEHGINVCDEREADLDEETAKKYINNGLTSTDIKKFVDVELPRDCKCVGTLNTYRAKFVMENWTIELDKNEYLQTVDYELECECDSNELLEKLKDYLLRNYGIKFRPAASKSSRFFKKLYGN